MSECRRCDDYRVSYNVFTHIKPIFNGCANCGAAWLNLPATLKHTNIEQEDLAGKKQSYTLEEVKEGRIEEVYEEYVLEDVREKHGDSE